MDQRRYRRARGLALAVVLAWAGLGSIVHTPTVAAEGDEGDESLRRAQGEFDKAQAAFLAKDWPTAIAGFEAAYALRPYSQFTYNIGATYQKQGQQGNDPEAYKKAVEYYNRYLTEEPQASDRAKVEKRIEVLRGEIKRLVDNPVPADPTASPPSPPPEVEKLGDIEMRGFIIIECNPSPASIYLDDKSKGEFAKTPWAGTLEGSHTLIIEARGYDPKEVSLASDPRKLVVHNIDLAKSNFLGWLEVSANVPGATVYLDDKDQGGIGVTPFQGNAKPGKHTVWVTAEGYDEQQREVEVVNGETAVVRFELKGSPVGYLNIRGDGIEDSKVYVDGKLTCDPGPCRRGLHEGAYTVEVARSGYKTYRRRIEILAKAETEVKVAFAPSPSRRDAIFMYAVAAAFAGGGVYLGLRSRSIRDELDADIAAGDPPIDANDPRFDHGKYYAFGANAAYGLAAISFLTAVYYTFRDKGPPSRGAVNTEALALTPSVSADGASVAMEVRW